MYHLVLNDAWLKCLTAASTLPVCACVWHHFLISQGGFSTQNAQTMSSLNNFVWTSFIWCLGVISWSTSFQKLSWTPSHLPSSSPVSPRHISTCALIFVKGHKAKNTQMTENIYTQSGTLGYSMTLNCRECVVDAGSAVAHRSVNLLHLWHLELFSVPLFLFVPLATPLSITQIEIEVVKTFSIHP